ncbi:MAG TPA: heterodisulfide reductase, partial [Nitrospiria bacterium]|nr:heterodisulfide reductase [Nitrospiria bacterium]
VAIKLTGQHIKSARKNGAATMVTPCPLCHMSLDIYQERAGEQRGERLDMPVFHLPQLVGLALGLSEKDLGLSRHLAPVAKALDQLTSPQP